MHSSGLRSGVRRSTNLFINGLRHRGEMPPRAIADAAWRVQRRGAEDGALARQEA